MTNEAGGMRAARVWDPVVRIGHWTLVASVLGGYATREGFGAIHEWLGYVALGVVAMRLIWGFVGPQHARFADFARGPGPTLAHAREVLAHREARYLGHNPLGGWMVILLLANVALAGITGWLYTTDAYWGDELMESIHDFFGQSILALAALHVAGVIFTSLRHRENLVAAMIHGRKKY